MDGARRRNRAACILAGGAYSLAMNSPCMSLTSARAVLSVTDVGSTPLFFSLRKKCVCADRRETDRHRGTHTHDFCISSWNPTVILHPSPLVLVRTPLFSRQFPGSPDD